MQPHIDTILAAAGTEPDPETGSVVPPIHLATTYERRGGRDFHYSRDDNPTRRALERTLALLEDGTDAAAFSSGMAAVTAVVASIGTGGHIVFPEDVYVGTRRLLTDVAPRWGVSATAADFTVTDSIAAAIRPETGVVWIESPSNPLLRITDIRAVVALAADRGVRTVVDNTWCSPVLQQPLNLGADLSVHSLTKYIGGHSDLLGGAIITRSQHSLFDGAREYQRVAGAVMDPFSAWLALRGLRTLGVRMQRACDNADQIASFLTGHARITGVHFPGLPGSPGREVAVRQMTRSGAMLSFETTGGRAFAESVPKHTRLFVNATSLGGTESLIEHRATAEGRGSTAPETLIRVSVGIEHATDLIEDLDRALRHGDA